MLIYQLFRFVSFSFAPKTKRLNFAIFFVDVFAFTYSFVTFVRVRYVRAVYPNHLPTFQAIFYKSLIFKYL